MSSDDGEQEAAVTVMQRLRVLDEIGGVPANNVAPLRPAMVGHRRDSRPILRQMLIAAAIAAGLLALWAALLPLLA